MSEKPHQPESRLRGTAVTRIRQGVGAAAVAKSEETDATPRILRLGCLEVELDPTSREIVLESGGIGVTNATIRGFWHLSDKNIASFDDSKVSSVASNLGAGTYIGYGSLSGDRVKEIKNGDHVKHDLTLHGSVLLVPWEDQYEVLWEVAERSLGADRLSEVSKMASGRGVNSLLREHELGGAKFDALVIYGPETSSAGPFAEGVVFYPEQALTIVNREMA